MSTPVKQAMAAWVGIDWGDKKHHWRLQAADSDTYERGEMENTPEAIDAWAIWLQQKFGGRPIAVCLEVCRALTYILSKYEHLVLYPAHPATAAKYRMVFSPSGAKD